MSLLKTNTCSLTLHSLIKQGEEILKAYDKMDWAIDAKLLMCYLLGCKEITLILNRDVAISSQIEESYMYLIAKRAQGIPLQYITKNQEFMGLSFYVDERVLIPRQDTETLVETIIETAKREQLQQIVEIGSGSGCISVSLAYYLKDAKITAIDISQEALDVTMKNVSYHEMNDRISCLKSDLLTQYKGEAESIDLFISNPPYISKEEFKSLMKDVNDYEPRLALTDEADGLTYYRKLSKAVKPFLRNDGILAFEIGCNQSEAVVQILTAEGYKNIQVIKDLTKRDRVVIARKAENNQL